MKKPLINLQRAMEVLNLSKSTIQHYVADRVIPHYKVGGRVLYDEEELIEWQHSFRVKTRNEIKLEASNYCITH